MTKKVERAIQRAVFAWLTKEYPNVMVHATMNEANYKDMAMGNCEGIPDLILWWTKDFELHTFFLELKTRKGKLSPSQKRWATEMKPVARNTYYSVAYGLSDAKTQLSSVLPLSRGATTQK